MSSKLLFVVESGTDVRLVEGLAERFHLTVLARRIVGGVEISRSAPAGVPVVVGPASRLQFAAGVLRQLMRSRGSVDRVIVQGYGPAALTANLVSRATGTPTFMLVCSPVELYYSCRIRHGTPAQRFRRHELAALKLLARANARLGRHYVVLSEHLAEVVRGHGTRRGVSVIPVYGVDTELFRPAGQTRDQSRAKLGLPESGKLVFFSSRIAPEKDGEALLQAARTLIDGGTDLWLLNLSGGYRDFTQAAERAGVSARVIARDAVHPTEELPDYYRACDLCVQASREEGLGFSPLEALACGTPVVAAAVGGLRETIVDGETGWSYMPGDAEHLARCVAEALNDEPEARRRAEAGRAMVMERYESKKAFDRLAALVEDGNQA